MGGGGVGGHFLGGGWWLGGGFVCHCGVVMMMMMMMHEYSTTAICIKGVARSSFLSFIYLTRSIEVFLYDTAYHHLSGYF